MARRALITKTRKTKRVVRVGKGIALAASGNTLTKDFKPKDTGVLHYGPEPSFSEHQPDGDMRQAILSDTYNWYSHFCDHKDAKAFLLVYLEATNADKEIIKLIRKSPDTRMIPTAGWVARCASRGLILDDKQKAFIQSCIDKLVALVNAGVKDEPVDGEVEDAIPDEKMKSKVNVQEIMRERADEAASEIEVLFDQFIADGCPKDFNITTKIVGEFSSRNILPQHVSAIINRWQRVLNEYNEAIIGEDDQLKEAFKSYSKTQMRTKVKFVETIIAELNGYVSLKQATKKVRVAKPVPVEKTVARLKYQRKDEALGIASVQSVKLHQATEVFLFDTARRKIIWLVADEYSKCLIVKGNAILGFDKKKSMSKTVRKPLDFMNEFMKASRPNTRKMVTDIKAVAAIPNGRFNENIIILKVW